MMEPPPSGDSEIFSKTIKLEQKLFYLDLKENARGRYLKISEKTPVSRTTIIVPSSGITWFVELFSYYSNGSEGELTSKELQIDTKIFYFDVGENSRGRFLKVTEVAANRSRSAIIIPSGSSIEQGWSSFTNILVEIHQAIMVRAPVPSQPLTGFSDSVGAGFISSHNQPVVSLPIETNFPLSNFPQQTISQQNFSQQNVPAARVVRAEQKKFFFDMGSNSRGHFLKISEVTGTDRSAIFLPASAIEQFHESLGYFLDYVKSQGLSFNTVANVRNVAPLKKKEG